MLPAAKTPTPLCRSSPSSVNSSLPLMAAAGKCNLAFGLQALGCLKLIMSFKVGGGNQSGRSETEDFESGWNLTGEDPACG